MRAYLLVTGLLFAAFGVFHFFIACEHFRAPRADEWSALGPVLIGVAACALALWAFRLARRGAKSAG